VILPTCPLYCLKGNAYLPSFATQANEGCNIKQKKIGPRCEGLDKGGDNLIEKRPTILEITLILSPPLVE